MEWGNGFQNRPREKDNEMNYNNLRGSEGSENYFEEQDMEMMFEDPLKEVFFSSKQNTKSR